MAEHLAAREVIELLSGTLIYCFIFFQCLNEYYMLCAKECLSNFDADAISQIIMSKSKSHHEKMLPKATIIDYYYYFENYTC